MSRCPCIDQYDFYFINMLSSISSSVSPLAYLWFNSHEAIQDAAVKWRVGSKSDDAFEEDGSRSSNCQAGNIFTSLIFSTQGITSNGQLATFTQDSKVRVKKQSV